MSIIKYKNKNGTTYAYESETYWDKEIKAYVSTRTCIGKYDENGNLIYSDRFKKDIPKPVLKEEIGSIAKTQLTSTFGGATYLLDQIGNSIGIDADLKACFPQHWKKILSIVYFLALNEDSSLEHFEKWGQTHHHPAEGDIPVEDMLDVFSFINKEGIDLFLNKQKERRDKEEVLVYDIRTLYSHSEALRQMQYNEPGKEEGLSRMNFLLIYGQNSGLPYGYKRIGGSVSSVDGLQSVFKELRLEETTVVLNNTFYNEQNMNELFISNMKFLIPVDVSINFVEDAFKTVNVKTDFSNGIKFELFIDKKNKNETYGVYAATTKSFWEYAEGEKKHKSSMYVHVFFNPYEYCIKLDELERYVDSLVRECQEGKRISEHETQYKDYFIDYDSDGENKIVVDNEFIAEKAGKYGKSAIVGNTKIDAITAYEKIRIREMARGAFSNLKDRFNLNISDSRLSKDSILDGKIFLEYITLIYLSYIHKQMHINTIYEKYTIQKLFDKLDTIKCYADPEGTICFGEVQEEQKEIYERLGVTPPVSYEKLCKDIEKV